MKRVIVGLVVVASLASLSFAEYAKKGTFEFGGTAGYTSSTMSHDSDDVTVTTLSLAPEVFYFVSDNWALGAALETSQTTMEATGSDDVKVNGTSLMFEPMYVFKGQRIYPYAGLLLGITSSDSDGIVTSLTRYGIQGGIRVSVVSNGLMNLGFRYRMGSGTVEDVDVDASDVSLSIGFSLFI